MHTRPTTPNRAGTTRTIVITATVALAALVSTWAQAADNADALASAIGGSNRSNAHTQRDQFRHPEQTLRFFGVRPDMTVVEVLPGGGWYTEILAPYLHDKGHLIEATYPENTANPFLRRMAKQYSEKLEANPDLYGRVTLQAFAPPDYIVLGPPHSADRILTFRNMHDLVYANPHGEVTETVMDRFFRAAYLALKPRGVLGVVAHRANPDASVSKSFKQGRLPESFVIRMAERAGFRLQAESEINANPKDPRDVPVWNLPPTLNAPENQRSKYAAIGESDRMTLKFVKPGEGDGGHMDNASE